MNKSKTFTILSSFVKPAGGLSKPKSQHHIVIHTFAAAKAWWGQLAKHADCVNVQVNKIINIIVSQVDLTIFTVLYSNTFMYIWHRMYILKENGSENGSYCLKWSHYVHLKPSNFNPYL